MTIALNKQWRYRERYINKNKNMPVFNSLNMLKCIYTLDNNIVQTSKFFSPYEKCAIEFKSTEYFANESFQENLQGPLYRLG